MGVTEGINTCPACNKKFTAKFVKYPDNDVRHAIGCPYCNATVDYASGTEDILTYKINPTSE